MKYLIVFCLLISAAQAKTFKASYSESLGFSSLCDVRDESINFSNGVHELMKNAEALCHGNARRVSPIVIDTECKDLHVWGAVGYFSTFTSTYECE